MKIKILKCAVLSAIILASASSAANAYDFNEKVYGKVQFNFGYSLQGYSGDIKDHINEVEAMNNLAYSFGGPKIKTNKHLGHLEHHTHSSPLDPTLQLLNTG